MTPEKVATSEPPPLWTPNAYKAATMPGNPIMKPPIGIPEEMRTLERDSPAPTVIAMSARFENAAVAETQITVAANEIRTAHPRTH